jgi:putative DNA primase/helicase
VYTATELAQFEDDDTGFLLPWAPNRRKVADVMDALAAVCYLDAEIHPPLFTCDGPPGQFVALANGLLSLSTGELLDHTPAFFNVSSVPFNYDPAAPEPKHWLTFLGQIFDDQASVDALQEWFGYVISGRTDQHKIMLMVGPTRAGKGTIVRVLEALVGRANVAAPTLSSLGTNFGLSPLIGKTLATVNDARLGGANVHQVVERLLSISGEDTLTIDRKYQQPWTGRLSSRLLVVSNELPNLGDASGAIVGRFLVLVLTQSWFGREDRELGDRLATELPGILNWALNGLGRLLLHGRFTVPTTADEIMMAMSDAASPVSAFVRECCEIGPTKEVDIDEIYRAFRRWSFDSGRERIPTKHVFGRDLRAVLPGIRDVRAREGDQRVRRYRGITVRSDQHWPSPRTGADQQPSQPSTLT